MKIHKNMTIAQILECNPRAVGILMAYGMGCMGCPSAQSETLEEAAIVHGFDVDELLSKLQPATEK